jgi:hypothetical protein
VRVADQPRQTAERAEEGELVDSTAEARPARTGVMESSRGGDLARVPTVASFARLSAPERGLLTGGERAFRGAGVPALVR